MVTIEKQNYKCWPNSWLVANGEIELVVTGDVGPRIIRFGFPGGQNFFKEFDDQMGGKGEPEWQPRGGHRLWIAPEDPVKTYAPDNGPVNTSVEDGVLTATEPVEPLTGLEKQITLRLASAGSRLQLAHRIRNAGSAPCLLAVWAPTMMAPGGVGIHGLPPRGSHAANLGPTNPLVMWAYTDLTDPRWT